MYDDGLKDIAIRNLEQKAIGIVQTTVALTAQGYIVNRAKQTRLQWSSILLHARIVHRLLVILLILLVLLQ